MNIFLGIIERYSKPVVIIVSFVLFAFMLIAVNSVFKPEFTYLTQTLGYSPEKAYQMMNDYGEAGRQAHLRVLIADIVMVMLYTALFSTTIYATFSKVFNNRVALFTLCLIPFILAASQLLEVLGVFTLLTHYQNKMFLLAQMVSIVTIIKTILTYICIALPFIGLISVIVKKVIY